MTENLNLVAKWRINEYKVTWSVDGVETVETYEYGQVPSFKGSTAKPSDNIYNYRFTKWDKKLDKVTSDVTYVAQYEKTYIEYTIKFVNDNDELITKKTYHYGDVVEEPTKPTKEATAKYTYEFAGWDKDIINVAGDATYKATYNEIIRSYDVTFVVGDEDVVKTYKYGEIPTFTESTAKTSDKPLEYTYNFVKWDKDFSEVVGEATYTAIYDQVYINYKIRFENDNGALLSEEMYHYGDTVITPAEPTKESDEYYSYNFAGWGKVVTEVTGDATYKATYTATPRTYKVTFVVGDQDVVKEYTYREVPTFIESTDKTSDNPLEYTYKFIEWDKDFVPVTGDETYTAIYEKVYVEYTAKFINDKGELINTETYRYGNKITQPADPIKNGYIFLGWYHNGELYDFNTTITGNVELVATYIVDSANLDFIVGNDDDILISDKFTDGSGKTVTDLINTEFKGINNSDKTIAGIDVIINYANATGSAQTIDCNLTTSSGTVSKPLTFDGKGSGNKTISFSGLNIEPGETFDINNNIDILTNQKIIINSVSIKIYFK